MADLTTVTGVITDKKATIDTRRKKRVKRFFYSLLPPLTYNYTPLASQNFLFLHTYNL